MAKNLNKLGLQLGQTQDKLDQDQTIPYPNITALSLLGVGVVIIRFKANLSSSSTEFA